MSTEPSAPPVPGAPASGSRLMRGLWLEFLRHGQRWLRCDFTRMAATPSERSALGAATPPILEPVAQDYVAWRRSMVWIAVLFASVGTVDELVGLFTLETGGTTGITGFAAFLQFLTFASRKTVTLAVVLLLGFSTANSVLDGIFQNEQSMFARFVPFLGYFMLGYLLRDRKLAHQDRQEDDVVDAENRFESRQADETAECLEREKMGRHVKAWCYAFGDLKKS